MKNASITEITIFQYDQYRLYLQDLIQKKRTESKAYTLRSLSLRAGFASHSFLSHVLKGERALSQESATKLAAALGVRGRSLQYFKTLVAYNHSSTVAEKNQYWSELRRLRGGQLFPSVQPSQYAYYDRWYLPVLRELMVSPHWQGDFSQLARQFRPALSIKEVQEGLQILLDIGMLQRVAGGRFALSNTIVSAAGIPGVVFRQARTQYMLRAIEATESLSKHERHASYAVVGTTQARFEEYCRRLDELRQEFLQGLDPNEPIEAVYAFNFQAFPLTKVQKK